MHRPVRLPGIALGVLFTSLLSAHEGIHEQIADVTRRLAAETEPANEARLLVWRGSLRRIHRDWQAAAEDFRRARELAPTLEIVDLHLGVLWLHAEEPARARCHLDSFLAKRPRSVKALVTRARVLTALGEHIAAADDYARAIACFDNLGGPGKPKTPLPEYYLRHARSLVAAGGEHAGDAIATLDEGLLRLGPVVTLELEALEIEVANARYDAALARVDRLASRATRKESWLARRGEILEKTGRPPDAIRAYGEALRAIEALSSSRRGHRKVEQLETHLSAAIERLARHAGISPRGENSGNRRVPREPADRTAMLLRTQRPPPLCTLSADFMLREAPRRGEDLHCIRSGRGTCTGTTFCDVAVTSGNAP